MGVAVVKDIGITKSTIELRARARHLAFLTKRQRIPQKRRESWDGGRGEPSMTLLERRIQLESRTATAQNPGSFRRTLRHRVGISKPQVVKFWSQ